MPAKNRAADRGLRQRTLLGVESLEGRRMLAVVWANEVDQQGDLDPSTGFAAEFGDNAAAARAIVQRAIADWNAVIDTNFDLDDNPATGPDLQLTIQATNIASQPGDQQLVQGAAAISEFGSHGGAVNGFAPAAAIVQLDDDGAGLGWFFDATPWEDEEFVSIGAGFAASFLDASAEGQAGAADFYQAVAHEIGHALGFGLISQLNDANASVYDVTPTGGGNFTTTVDPSPTSQLTANSSDFLLGALSYVGLDAIDPINLAPLLDPDDSVATSATFTGDEELQANELWRYTFRDGSGRTVPLTEQGGGHLYDAAGAGVPNELMNDGRSLGAAGPGAPATTTRRLISDLTAEFLVDAYGYHLIGLPSEIDSMHATFDPIAGALVVQGSPRDSAGAGLSDSIDLSIVGDQVEVSVTTPSLSTTERFDLAAIKQILIAGHGGADTVTIDPALAPLRQDVDYVVGSTLDAVETSGSVANGVAGDSIVDLDPDAPGSQTTLRAAVIDANQSGGASTIYLGPNQGAYTLTREGTESSDAVFNDLDVTSTIAIVGGGAGRSVIDASGLGATDTVADDRLFEVAGAGDLTLSGLTLTGGDNDTPGADGGAIAARAGTRIELDRVAVLGNKTDQTAGVGGGLFLDNNAGHTVGATAVIRDSVFAGNSAWAAGAVYLEAPSSLTVGGSIFAANTINSAFSPTVRVNGASVTNEGNNLADSDTADQFSPSVFVEGDDHVGPVDHVVTTVVDEFTYELVSGQVAPVGETNPWTSLREAVVMTNRSENADPTRPDEIWAPDWGYVLTIDRVDLAGEAGTDRYATDGDLDIWGGNVVIGVAGDGLDVEWRAGASADMAFDLLGDYVRNDAVEASDYTAWRDDYLNSPGAPQGVGDGDNDGNTELVDRALWDANSFAMRGLRIGGTTYVGGVATTVGKSSVGYMLPGDADGDGVVDLNDKGEVAALLGAVHPAFDWNGSGVVDTSDLQVIDENLGATGPGYVDPPIAPITSPSLAPRYVNGYANAAPVTVVGQGPQVVDFTVASSSAEHGFGALVGSGEQLRSIDVAFADRVSVTFNEEVLVLRDALQLTNLDGASPASVVDFVFDITALTATWVFDAPLADGRWLATLSDSVFDLQQDALDGDFFGAWALGDTGTATFPTGDGDPGGEFRFHFTVLAGDADHDNVDGATDYTEWHSIEPGAIYVSTTTDELDTDLSFGDLSLREAVQHANANSGTTIFVPEAVYTLTRVGSESHDASYNDLDITAEVRIVGAGAGRSVVDNSALPHTDDRAFDVAGSGALEIAGVTLANGGGSSVGQAVRVAAGGSLIVDSSAIVNHESYVGGVAIAASDADVVVTRSVFTNNHNTGSYYGAAIRVEQTGGGSASLAVGESVFALNSQATGYGGGSGAKSIEVSGAVTKTNSGHNLYDDASGGFFDTTPGPGDHLGTADYVVTSIADTFDHTNDDHSLSVREAVDLANQSSGLEEVWLPAWRFTLTRDRQTYGGGSSTDIDAAFGDLDVKDSLVLRGVEGRTSVAWKPGVVDSVFDLLGDYDQDGQSDQDVNSGDLQAWYAQDGSGSGTSTDWEAYSADGDDDGDVDSDDATLWTTYNGNTLDLFDVAQP